MEYYKKDLKEFIGSCDICQQISQVHKTFKAPLEPIKTGYFNQILHIDYASPLNNCQGNYKYLLIMVDSFTNLLEVAPTQDMSSETTLNCLMKYWITRYSFPAQIQSDHAANLTGEQFTEFCKKKIWYN